MYGENLIFSSGAVCLVISSGVFSEDDYIRDFADYLKAFGCLTIGSKSNPFYKKYYFFYIEA
jgi:hypothetical protein